MEPISLRAYAKLRAARGLAGSAMAVSSAIKTGRLVKSVVYVGGQPKIADPALADQEWASNTDLQRAINAAGGSRALAAVASEDQSDAVEEVKSSTQRLTAARADLAELKRDEARGVLLPAKDVERRLVEVFTASKTRLLAIPSRARQQLPHLSAADVGVLEGLVREALEDLAEAET